MRSNDFDVVIVGSGIMGASVAQLIRERRPEARVVMLDAGPVLGSVPGQHLHDIPDGRMRLRYHERVASGIQGLYVGADAEEELGESLADVAPGMYRLETFCEDSSAMPTAALAWNVGGMGVHWTAATPAAWGREIPEFISPVEWARDMETAQRVLKVRSDPIGASPLRSALVSALNEVFGGACAAGREVQPLPMAMNPDGHGGLARTGPNQIFPAIAERNDPNFELRTGQLVTAISHARGTATGVVTREVSTGVESRIHGDVTIVCADTFRTPQLLFASDIRPTALGRFLNEHVFVTARAGVDLGSVGLEPDVLARQRAGEWLHTTYWLPHSDEAQPFNGQLSGTVRFAPNGQVLDASAGLALYVPTETQRSNRVEFSDSAVDASGMPRMRIHFERSEADLKLVHRAQQEQERAGLRLGSFDPATDSAVLPPGTSLHMTGTTRMGPLDDGTSVCDPNGGVWGFDNLYLAGCGVLPTALVGNSTLTGVVTAVRAARAAIDRVAG